jgi:hypothetical protein
MHAFTWRGRAAALPLLAAVALAPSPAAANPCFPRDELLALLAERYGEVPAGAGLSRGHLVELLARPDGASWTVLVIRPDGVACPVAAGEGWTDLREATPAPGETAS